MGTGYHALSTDTHPCGDGTIHVCTEEQDCDLKNMIKNEGQPDEETVNPCEIVRLNPTDTLTIHFNLF